MKWDETSGEPVATEAEFKTALTALIMEAHENGVSVDQPWLCQTGGGTPDYEAMFTELDETVTDD